MDLYRPTAVQYGIVAGLAAVAAEVLFSVNQPPAYGICMACHGEDALNWTVNHLFGTHFQVAPISQSAPLLTTVGVVVGAAVLEESGAKIAAALKGRPARRTTLTPMRMRLRYPAQRPLRATAKWRAAA